MTKATSRQQPAVDQIARAERFLNRVLAYQAAIAVHHLDEDFGIDVQELTLSVQPAPTDEVGAYRVVCTIVRASASEPVVLDLVVHAEKAIVPTAK